MEKFININEQKDILNFTLIIPSICVGNVGQLTVDLLITSYNFKKFGTLWHPAMIPSVGGDPFTGDSSEICTECELFLNTDLKIVVLQFRSSIEYKLAAVLFQELKRFAAENKFSRVILLTSSFAHEMHNILTSRYRYLTNDETSKHTLTNTGILPMESTSTGNVIINGGGFACAVYETLKDSLKCMVLIKYCSEGDNRVDAQEMLNVLIRVFKNFTSAQPQHLENVVYPKSWEYVFGNPPPTGIY